MNNEAVLAFMAQKIRSRLSAENPLRERLFATVAEQKDPQATHTFGVLQTAKGQAQEIVKGNYTFRIPCRLYAFFYPPEDAAYTADSILGWMQEASLALMQVGAEILGKVQESFLVLDCVANGPLHWAPVEEGGWEGSVAFTLTVQF